MLPVAVLLATALIIWDIECGIQVSGQTSECKDTINDCDQLLSNCVDDPRFKEEICPLTCGHCLGSAPELGTGDLVIIHSHQSTTPRYTTPPFINCRPTLHQFQIGSQCFKYHIEDVTWFEARASCQEQGGDLAQPNDLTHLRQELIDRNANWDFWLGGSDLEFEGNWAWLSGKLITGPWRRYQPSGGTRENCLDFRRGSNALLNDHKCYRTQKFICEFGAVLGPGYSESGTNQTPGTSGRFEGPFDKTYDEDQCEFLGYDYSHGDSLSECKSSCRKKSGCTAISYRDTRPSTACVLFGCPRPVPLPTRRSPPWQGFILNPGPGIHADPYASAVTCVDELEDCPKWATLGYCGQFSTTQSRLCRKSCHVCGLFCVDKYNICSELKHECSYNRKTREEDCPRTCGYCIVTTPAPRHTTVAPPRPPGPTTAPCVDESEKCAEWAMLGYCNQFGDGMSKICRKSCNFCDRTFPTLRPATTERPYNTEAPTPPPDKFYECLKDCSAAGQLHEVQCHTVCSGRRKRYIPQRIYWNFSNIYG